MNKEATFVQKYQIPLFFLLAYLLSWWSIPFANGAILPYGPALAAVIILALTKGKAGLRELWSRVSNWRAGWWYLIGPLLIVGYLLGAYVVSSLLGASPSTAIAMPAGGTFLMLFALGGLWEEPGWSGYALPELQQRYGDQKYGNVIASLVLGAGRGLWHLPLVLSGNVAWYDAVIFSFAFQIMITWLYNKSRGSVPAIMVFHYASNILGGAVMLSAYSGAAHETFYMLMVGFAVVIAIVITVMSKFRLGEAAVKPTS